MNGLYNQGINEIHKAVEYDKKGNSMKRSSSVEEYEKALVTKMVLKYSFNIYNVVICERCWCVVEKNPYVVKNIRMKCIEYLDRAEDIKEKMSMSLSILVMYRKI